MSRQRGDDRGSRIVAFLVLLVCVAGAAAIVWVLGPST
jgi:hypothetical protein